MKKQKFQIGDMVKYGLGLVHIIANIFHDGNDYKCELLQIYPVRKVSKYSIVHENALTLHSKVESKEYELLINYLSEERAKKGWTEEPDYITEIKKRTKVKKTKKEVKLDTIRYDQFKTTDECLDAMNDLKRLYDMFGDEAYLQLYELVQNRLKELF